MSWGASTWRCQHVDVAMIVSEQVEEELHCSGGAPPKMVITGVELLRRECYQQINQVSVAHLYDQCWPHAQFDKYQKQKYKSVRRWIVCPSPIYKVNTIPYRTINMSVANLSYDQYVSSPSIWSMFTVTTLNLVISSFWYQSNTIQ